MDDNNLKLNSKLNIPLFIFILISSLICVFIIFSKYIFYVITIGVISIIIYYFIANKYYENMSNNMNEMEYKQIIEPSFTTKDFYKKMYIAEENGEFKMPSPIYNQLEIIEYPSHFTPNYAESIFLSKISKKN